MTAGILDALFAGLRPKAPVAPADFAERAIVLPAATNARGGPLRLTKYQRDALNMIAEPGVHTLAALGRADRQVDGRQLRDRLFRGAEVPPNSGRAADRRQGAVLEPKRSNRW